MEKIRSANLLVQRTTLKSTFNSIIGVTFRIWSNSRLSNWFSMLILATSWSRCGFQANSQRMLWASCFHGNWRNWQLMIVGWWWWWRPTWASRSQTSASVINDDAIDARRLEMRNWQPDQVSIAPLPPVGWIMHNQLRDFASRMLINLFPIPTLKPGNATANETVSVSSWTMELSCSSTLLLY